MNVKVTHVQMEEHVLISLMVITAHVSMVIMELTAKMVTLLQKQLDVISTQEISEINECESFPCSNGATCIDIVDGYHCICVNGYNYTHCENGS